MVKKIGSKTVDCAQLEHKIRGVFVRVIQWSKLVQINPFPLVVHRAIVHIKWRVPLSRMPIKRSRLYLKLRQPIMNCIALHYACYFGIL